MKHVEYSHTLLEYPLPQTTDVEAQLLADIIDYPTSLPDIMSLISADMFTDQEAKRIYGTVLQMWSKGDVIDITTVAYTGDFNWFRTNVLSKRSSIAGVLGHAQKVREAYIKRVAYKTALSLLNKTQDEEATAATFCDIADSLTSCIHDESGVARVHSIAQVANELLDNIQDPSVVRVTTGIRYLDSITYGGFHGGWLVVLAARPGVGKTALALHMARSAKDSGKHVLYFSLEMEDTELVQRLLLSTRKVTAYELATGSVNWPLLEEAVAQVATGTLYIDDQDRALDGVRAICRAMKAQKRLDEVVIDYLGLMDASFGANIIERISYITKELKNLAKELHVPILLLSQLNRELAKERRHPRLSDLRESGSIEQDADMVLLLEDLDAQGECKIDPDDNGYLAVRERNENGDVLDHRVNCFVAKHRHGRAMAKIRLLADRTYNNFTDIDNNDD